MKNFIWILGLMFLGILTTSCLDDERVDNIYYRMKPIDSVDIQAVNGVFEVTEIKTYFTRENNCEDFFDYDYRAFGPDRIVSLVTWSVESDSCTEINEPSNSILRFMPERPGEYNFRFWSGYDEDNRPTYIEKNILIE